MQVLLWGHLLCETTGEVETLPDGLWRFICFICFMISQQQKVLKSREISVSVCVQEAADSSRGLLFLRSKVSLDSCPSHRDHPEGEAWWREHHELAFLHNLQDVQVGWCTSGLAGSISKAEQLPALPPQLDSHWIILKVLAWRWSGPLPLLGWWSMLINELHEPR